MTQPMIMPVKYFFDKNGNPLAFGKVYTYATGTTTDKVTYTTEVGDVPNTNPVILNSEGYATIYLSGSYNIVVDDANDVNIWSQDPVSSNHNQEWINCEVPTYLTTSSFKVTGNLVSIYDTGRVARIDNGVSLYDYSVITGAVFSGGETTVSLTDAIVTPSVSEVCTSIVGSESTQNDPVILSKTVILLNDIADLVAATNSANITLKEYDIVKLRGRLTNDDGGGAEYQIRLTSEITAVAYKDHTLSDVTLTAVWQKGVSALTTRKEDTEFKPEDKFYGGPTGIAEGGGVLILGDSNTQGYGSDGAAAESYRTGFAFKTVQSIYNAVDQGVNEDRGYRFGTILSLASELDDPGVTTDGTLQFSGGAVDSFITLTAGQSISITGREVAFCDCFYTSASGSLEFYLNDVLFDTKALTGGTGVNTTFPTEIIAGTSYINDYDVLKIKAAAGSNANITGLLTLRDSSGTYSPHVVVAAKSGWALDDFNDDARNTAIASHMNLIRGAGAKILVVVALGTNDIYNPTKSNDPAGYISELSNLVVDYQTYLTGDPEFLIEIPPESGTLFGTDTGDAYLEYVSAIIDFCQTNGHQMLRLDKSSVSGSNTYLYDNGVHFDAAGSTIVAKELCRAIGIPYNPYIHTSVISEPPLVVSADPTKASSWVNFNGTGTVVIRDSYNVSSITDNGVGDYDVNFTTDLNDTDYSVIATSGVGTSLWAFAANGGSQAVSDFNIILITTSGTVEDSANISAATFGGVL